MFDESDCLCTSSELITVLMIAGVTFFLPQHPAFKEITSLMGRDLMLSLAIAGPICFLGYVAMVPMLGWGYGWYFISGLVTFIDENLHVFFWAVAIFTVGVVYGMSLKQR